VAELGRLRAILFPPSEVVQEELELGLAR
jgi:hypothetical protein